jgi:hypothetical protein
LLVRDDDVITSSEYQDLIARMDRIQSALKDWVGERPAMPKGYARTMSPEMLHAGTTAWNGIRDLCRGPLATFNLRSRIKANTKTALTNFGDVLMEYVEAIMLGGTDLALIFNDQTSDFPLVDCAGIHVEAIVRLAVG